MPTNITSAVTIAPSISGSVQSSFVNGTIPVSPSISGVLQSLFINSSATITLGGGWTAHAEQFRYDPGIAIAKPMFTFQGEAQDSAMGTLGITIPSLLFSGTAIDGPLGQLSVSLPRLAAAFATRINENATISITLPSLSLLGTIKQGVVGTINISLPTLEFSASSHLSTEATLGITLPMLQTLFQILPTTYTSMVLNIRNNALTLYSNYSFNSFCRFNGKNLGATSTKIFDLDSGTTDNGTLVNWNFRTGYLDLEQKIKKRLHQAWFSYKSDGEIIVTIVQPNGDTYEYPLSGVEITESGIRAVFGKGIKSKYIALDVKNVDGSSITLDTMKLLFEKTTKER